MSAKMLKNSASLRNFWSWQPANSAYLLKLSQKSVAVSADVLKIVEIKPIDSAYLLIF
jgi:hypothetical protein